PTPPENRSKAGQVYAGEGRAGIRELAVYEPALFVDGPTPRLYRRAGRKGLRPSWHRTRG
ncbi:hypothetical protein, partial [Nonomuraea sp. SBT364]|uniref:hypothetical protein n=1 Tax=Nonomuraea sp. SBT364 TaxID=1580530 RepID=UPI000A4323C5